jgi:hypothetical protein
LPLSVASKTHTEATERFPSQSSQSPRKYDREDFSPHHVKNPTQIRQGGFLSPDVLENPQTQRRGFPSCHIEAHTNTTGRMAYPHPRLIPPFLLCVVLWATPTPPSCVRAREGWCGVVVSTPGGRHKSPSVSCSSERGVVVVVV